MGSIESRKYLRPVTYTPAEVAKYKTELRRYKDEVRLGAWEKLPYNEFLNIVSDRLDPSIDPQRPICPFCSSYEVTVARGSQTCLGGSHNYDPNHHWDFCTCESCSKSWGLEYKGSRPDKDQIEPRYNAWYTVDGDRKSPSKIIRGLPTCFEDYAYTCSRCKADVHRHNYNKGTRDRATILSSDCDGKNKSYETWFECQGCDARVQSTTEYFSEASPHHPRMPHSLRKFRWTIVEEIGIAVINDYALSTIQTG